MERCAIIDTTRARGLAIGLCGIVRIAMVLHEGGQLEQECLENQYRPSERCWITGPIHTNGRERHVSSCDSDS